jgi:4-hydroxythreonine-4-phosphate dehydrogenase
VKKIAISLGDPNGISAEIIAKFLAKENETNFVPCIYASKDIFLQWERILQKKSPQNSSYWRAFFDKVQKEKILFSENCNEKLTLQPAKVCAQSGKFAFDFFTAAISETLEKKNAALVTAPINKAALQKAGISHKGHTPILVEMTKAKNYTMAFTSDAFSLALVTDHIPLNQVATHLTKEKILQTIFLCDDYAKSRKIASPKIAVCGLNPHAGEEQTLGDEEQKIITPAIQAARKKKINVLGPVAADSIFHQAKIEKLDFIIAMYHDQGLCGWKSNFFEKSAGISLGLPIIRTSVSHGTAFDIAGLGVANPSSLAYAYQLACEMATGDEKRF